MKKEILVVLAGIIIGAMMISSIAPPVKAAPPAYCENPYDHGKDTFEECINDLSLKCNLCLELCLVQCQQATEICQWDYWEHADCGTGCLHLYEQCQ